MKRGTKREVLFMIRMSLAEREELEVVAQKLGLPLSTWLRSLALRVAREIPLNSLSPSPEPPEPPVTEGNGGIGL